MDFLVLYFVSVERIDSGASASKIHNDVFFYKITWYRIRVNALHWTNIYALRKYGYYVTRESEREREIGFLNETRETT